MKMAASEAAGGVGGGGVDLSCLFCFEADLPRRSIPDAAFLRDSRVLKNLLELDEKHSHSASYFLVQTDLKPAMREKVTCWMNEVTLEENLEEGVFALSVSYLDRFLSVSSRQIRRTQLQLIASVCIFIASKFKGRTPISARHLVWFTDNSITHDEIIEWELVVLQGLKWDLSSITAYDFIDHLFNRLPLEPNDVTSLRKHAAIFIDLCATDLRLADSPSSMIAASSILAAVKGMSCRSRYAETEFLQTLSDVTSIDKELIAMCQEQIESLLTLRIARSAHAQQKNNEDDDDDASGDTDSEVSSQLKSSSSSSSQPTTPTDVRDITIVDHKK